MNDLEDKIWNIINVLRGQKNIQELKEIIISFLFLKFANDQLHSNNINIIEVPQDANWNFLCNESLPSHRFINTLQNGFLSIEEANIQLKNTFSVFEFQRKFNSKKDLNLIYHIFHQFSELKLDNGIDDYQIIIDKILQNFAQFEGKKGGDFTTPSSVSTLMIKLLSLKGGTILDSACGTGGFFDSIEKAYPDEKFNFYGQEFNPSTLALAKLRFAFNHNNKVVFGNPISTLQDDQFPDLKADYVIMHPPFNIKSWMTNKNSYDSRFKYGLPPKSNANLAWIQHAIHHLNDKGKGVLLMSNGALNARGKEAEIRRNLINDDLIEAIITLPSQLLANTNIPSSLWLLNKNRVHKNKILFIEGSDLGVKPPWGSQRVLESRSIDEVVSSYRSWTTQVNYSDQIGFCKEVSFNELSKNNFSLLSGRYVGIPELSKYDLSNAIKLKEILEYVTPNSIESNIIYKLVTVKNLSSNPDAYYLNEEWLPEGKLKFNFKLLDTNVLLVSKVGTNLKPTFYKSSKNKLAYSASSIYSFKVDESKVNIEYLIAELNKDYVQIQFDSIRKGSAMPFINQQDLLRIKLNIPSRLEQQKKILEHEREFRFQSTSKELGFAKEIRKLKDTQIKDLGSKKHNLMQHLNNVKASVDVLNKMMDINGGVLKANEVIDPRRGVTVENRFLRLQESLNKVIYYVDNITNEKKFDNTEIINPVKFLEECKERGIQDNLYDIEIIKDKDSFQDRKPLISISKNDFEEIYNNILENARNHGFVDDSKKYLFRVTVAYVDDFVNIFFENNGKPFSKGIAERFDVKGEKAGVTAGTGIGLWKVAEIANHFGAKIDVTDSPESDFPVGFRFKFNLEIL